jgi:hypothetical protein
VGVVGADVVLDQQALAIAGGRGVQARMVELEGRGAVQACHEGPHPLPIPGFELPHLGAVDDLAGQQAGELVERLVEVHHQQMQAVCAFPAAVGEGIELVFVQLLARQGGQPLLPMLNPLLECAGGAGGFHHGPGHHRQILAQGLGQTEQVGNMELLAEAARPARQIPQPGLVEAGGGHLPGEVRCHAIGVAGGAGCRLEEGQIEFQPVVGGQCGLHPHRQEQPRLPHRRYCLSLFHRLLRSPNRSSLEPPDEGFFTA